MNVLLRNQNGQHARFVLRLDILRLHVADIKAARAGTGIALLTQNTTLLVLLVLVKPLLGADGQIAIPQIETDFILLEEMCIRDRP